MKSAYSRLASFPYRSILAAARFLSPVLERGEGKLARGLTGRRDAHERLAAWGERDRDPRRRVAWFHAPSVGEGLQARAVIEALRALDPSIQIVFTHFSPSAETLARRFGADVAAYLPWDLTGPVCRALDAVCPDLLVFTRTEVWPVLAGEARLRGAKVGIVGGVVSERAGRLRWPVRRLMRTTWEGLDFAAVVTASDGARFAELGVSDASVVVTGDPGIDSAWARSAAVDPGEPWLAPFRADRRRSGTPGAAPPTLVAGSTWPGDEAVLLPALDRVRADVPALRVLIAPHEPSPARVDQLLEAFSVGGWAPTTLTRVERAASLGNARAIVVDRVGVLAQLYSLADVSFVGGGFGSAGLHSVLEPAAAGVPVMFGPEHSKARAASDLLAVGGAKIAQNADEVGACLTHWLRNPVVSKGAGRSAQDYIQSHRGAAVRSAELLAHCMKVLPE